MVRLQDNRVRCQGGAILHQAQVAVARIIKWPVRSLLY